MTEAEARELAVAALHHTTGMLDRSSVSQRLRDPAGEVDMSELALDSLDLVEWSVEMEKLGGISIDTADLAAAGSLSDVVRVLMRQAATL